MTVSFIIRTQGSLNQSKQNKSLTFPTLKKLNKAILLSGDTMRHTVDIQDVGRNGPKS